MKRPYWLISADEARAAYNIKQARRHEKHPQQDVVHPAWLQTIMNDDKMNDENKIARMMDASHISKTVGVALYLMKYMAKGNSHVHASCW